MSVISRINARGPFKTLPLELCAAGVRFLQRKITWFKLKFYKVRIGDNCHIGKGLRFVQPWNLLIEGNVTVGIGVRLWSEKKEGQLVLGRNCDVGRDSVLDFSGGLTIEENVLLSEGVIIYTHDHGYEPRSEPSASSLVIAQDAWIGARAIILPSVNRIGQRALIGAGAVVTCDVPDDHIFIGGSGRLVKKKGSSSS